MNFLYKSLCSIAVIAILGSASLSCKKNSSKDSQTKNSISEDKIPRKIDPMNLHELIKEISHDKYRSRSSLYKEELNAFRNFLSNQIEEIKKNKISKAQVDIIYQNFQDDFGKNMFVYVHHFGYPDSPKGHKRKKKINVLLSAHYDHTQSTKSSEIYNGAADNGASVGILLKTLKKTLLSTKIHEPILFAFFDKEENDLMGSKHFVENNENDTNFDLGSINLLINLDIIGLDYFPWMKENIFIIGSESGGDNLKANVAMSSHDSGLKNLDLSMAFGFDRSDHYAFLGMGKLKIPTVFITNGDGAQYHTSADKFENLNMKKVEKVAILVERLLHLSLKTKYRFSHFGKKFPIGKKVFGHNTYLPTDSDLNILKEITNKVIENKDIFLSKTNKESINPDYFVYMIDQLKSYQDKEITTVNPLQAEKLKILQSWKEKLNELSSEYFKNAK